MRKYPIKYTDKFGQEKSEIFSDGSTMFLTLRGIRFEGSDFEGLSGEVVPEKFDYEMFQDGSGDLTNFRMEVQFPIKLMHGNQELSETLTMNLQVGKDLAIHDAGSIVNTVELNCSLGKFTSNKKVEWFEDAMIGLQKALPKNTYLKTCLSCKYSNYHPVGNGMFGSLYCFKKIKNQLPAIQNKYDLMDLWTEEAVKNGDIFNVQEVFDCWEYAVVGVGDWCYKDWGGW